ncbi:MAG: triose-phosphate isomerase [Gemmatimonadota bacterium]|nr:triose-phosphate isomerase [Gemmatimonadota bacterium]
MSVIAGNWKMHHGPAETRAFFEGLALDEVDEEHEVVIFPPTISLSDAVRASERLPRVALGVQHIHWEDEGAFTGETSARMARDAGATFVLVGHSERRHVFGETDEEVRNKVEAAIRHELTPVVCVGETLEERRAGRVEDVILRQLGFVLPALAHEGVRFLVAYEPVWAIGTGETATPDDAAAAHATLRGCLEDGVGVAGAPNVPILYGGSVKPANAAALLAAQDVDGVLVGGASFDPGSFAAIGAAASR